MRLYTSGRGTLSASLFLGLSLLGVCPVMNAASLSRLSGRISGYVKNASGVAQMGATVVLSNRFDKPVLKAITDDQGRFSFDSLAPESYSVRVSLSSFVPAVRKGIQINSGAERFLSIQLATLFSSVDLFYTPPPGSLLMSEEWRASLRSALSTRPVLRALPTWDPGVPRTQTQAKVFSGTRGVVKLAGADVANSPAWGTETDLGTAFAVGTSVFGRSQVQFSGNLGYSSATGIPAAGFRTTFQRASSSAPGFEIPNPQVSVTMRQVFLPSRAGMALSGSNSGLPMLRTLSATVADRMQLADQLLLEYGASLDSVQFLDRLNYLSPFARLTWDGKSIGTVRAAYSSGLPPVDLLISERSDAADLQRQLSTVALFPKITRIGGRTQAQRVQNLEIGYVKRMPQGELFAAAYRQGTANGAVALLGAPAELMSSDLVPDLGSNAGIFNIGGYYRTGFLVGWTQNLATDWKLSTAYGLGAVLRTDQRSVTLTESSPTDAQAIRDAIYKQQRHFVSMRVNGTLPRLGTKVYSSYLWTDYRALSPFHTSLTTQGLADSGLNFGVRQPIAGFFGWGRIEINGEVRNLLSQGYVPITTSTGQTMWLIPTPKQLRGGLSFIF